MPNSAIRLDYEVIGEIIEPGSTVLDLGCGNGDLLFYLVKEKKVKAQGIELNDQAIYQCVEKGLSVFHGDIDSGLSEYPDKSFDYVLLNQSMQELRKIDFGIEEALRVGRKVIVGFPNFAYIKARFMLFFKGKAPVTKSLPYNWYDTPNLHFLSMSDFKDFCRKKNIKILNTYYLGKKRTIKFWPNLLALNSVFVITGS